MTWSTGPDGARVAADGRALLDYGRGDGLPAHHAPRPVAHPVLTPGGRVVTESAPADHPWHHGLSFAVATIAVEGEAAPVNLWGGPTYLPGEGYRDLPNLGRQVVVDRVADDEALVESLEWRAASGAAFVREERRIGARLSGGLLVLSWESRWRSVGDRAIRFGSPTTAGRENAGYGGLFLRGAPGLLGARVFVPGAAPTAGRVRPEEVRPEEVRPE